MGPDKPTNQGGISGNSSLSFSRVAARGGVEGLQRLALVTFAVYRWGQIADDYNLSPPVSGACKQFCILRPRTPRVFVRTPGPV